MTDNQMPLKPGWNGEPGAPKDPPPEDVVIGEDGRPKWTEGPHGPEWLTNAAAKSTS